MDATRESRSFTAIAQTAINLFLPTVNSVVTLIKKWPLSTNEDTRLIGFPNIDRVQTVKMVTWPRLVRQPVCFNVSSHEWSVLFGMYDLLLLNWKGFKSIIWCVCKICWYYLCTDLSVANCTANHPGCETVWNTNVRYLYNQLIAGTLGRDRLQTVCRFGFCAESLKMWIGNNEKSYRSTNTQHNTNA